MTILMTSGSQARRGVALAAILAFAGGCIVGRATAPTGALVADTAPAHAGQQHGWGDGDTGVPPSTSHPTGAPPVPATGPDGASNTGVAIITPQRFNELSQAARQNPDAARKMLQEIKGSPDATTRFTLANVLADSQRPMLTAQIQQWLGSASQQDRALGFELLKNLGEVPPAMAQEARKAILEESDPVLLASALEAFRPSSLEGGAADKEIMARQLRLLSQNPNAEVRQQSLSKLVEVDHSPSVEADLTRALQDPDASVRVTAISGLVQAGVRSDAVTSELMRLSMDAETEGPVRTSAIEALGQFRLTPEQQRQLSAVQGR